MTTRLTVQKLICEDLNYCCEWAFFTLHKRTALIAHRLGVTPRAVRYHKAQMREGELCCQNTKRCLKGKLV